MLGSVMHESLYNVLGTPVSGVAPARAAFKGLYRIIDADPFAVVTTGRHTLRYPSRVALRTGDVIDVQTDSAGTVKRFAVAEPPHRINDGACSIAMLELA